MKENISEKDLFLSIDQDLKSMASNVPEMPDSFRSGWRQAVRNEAGQHSANPENTPSESASPSEKAPAGKLVRRPRRWTYLLSAAAALIFLFAGTLATRGMLSPRLKKNISDAGGASLSAVEEKESAVASEKPRQASPDVSGANDIAFEADAVSHEDMYSASEESALSCAYMESAEECEEASEEEAFSDSVSSFESKTESAAVNKAAGNSDRSSVESAEAAGPASPTAAAAESPASPTEPPAAVSTANPPAGENTGTRIAWFLEDMGAFILAALPYMAAAGILLLIVIFIRHKKTRKDEENIQ